ncbi:rRNA-processing protein sof1 [Clydaea vesicula]|uniref:rRNA-processing protein sof1 n=1 Tax=Clydaea vesicula TaxID=447962 RepID=A0AAD5U5Y3_9FUNG|nr:rRNA-processing protein sof1 [Clydaea vesicula]KAJ3395514.1 rRNA-processing protein sof1 [Lobulomyces angularis]
MKISVISREEDITLKERINDISKTHRNLNPELHPFERAREYTRALNATKLERLFAAPFIDSLEGHIDGVYSLAKHPTDLTALLSGSGDGEIRYWNLATKQTVWKTTGHQGFVRGMCAVPFGNNFFSVGDDKTVKLWDFKENKPLNTYAAKNAFSGIDHHRNKPWFVTSSTQIDLWDHERADPIQALSWGADTITTVKMNQTETSILASTGSDRTIILYDLRTSSPISKVIMEMRSNAISWNPMEAFNFTVANENHNCYTFDMRNLKRSINILKDHVSAVLDLDYSPTGQEIVTGGYDKTIRIFNSREGHSRDVYHTKRMQRIFCVKYSMDSKFVLSGSDDGNIRLWKNNSNEKIGTKNHREKASLNYTTALKERYKHMPEINRISKQRKVPKAIKKAASVKRIQTESIKRKQENVRKHSKPGSVKRVPLRDQHIITTEK